MEKLKINKPPDWLKEYSQEAVQLAIRIYNANLEKGKSKAKTLALDAVKKAALKVDSNNLRAETDISYGQFNFRASEAGLEWEALLIAPGLSKGYPRFYWSEDILQESVNIFQGVDINAYEITADYYSHLKAPNNRDIEDIKKYLTSKKVGWVEKAWFDYQGIRAIIKFLPEERNIPNKIQQGIDQGNNNVLGLSIDSQIKGYEIIVDDMTVIMVTKIVSCSSVDVVTRPAAGGKFFRARAGLEGGQVDKDKIIELIKQKRPDLLKDVEPEQLNEDELIEMARMAMEPVKEETKKAAADDIDEKIKNSVAEATKEIKERAAMDLMLSKSLAASNLPDMAKIRIEKVLKDKKIDQKMIDDAIKDEKEYLGKMGVEDLNLEDEKARVSGGISGQQRAIMGIDRMFGLSKEDMVNLQKLETVDREKLFQDMRAAQDYDEYEDVPAFKSLRDAYIYFTGDKEITGVFQTGRAAQDMTSATFPLALGNTLNRRLVADYRRTNFNENLIISIKKSAPNFKNMEAVMVGYFSGLEVVNELDDYNEIAAITDEEATYKVVKRGNILTISREMIINDDLSLVQRIVNRLGWAAKRTHAKYVWGLVTGNANCTDGTPFFTALHGNLGSDALGFTSVYNAYIALANMKEKDSDEVIGLLDDPSVKPVLVYPNTLIKEAESVINDDFYYGDNTLTSKIRNPMKGKISGAQVSLLSDVNDWFMFLPSKVADIIEISYLNGREEPELFLADSPTNYHVMKNDAIKYKIRHEYAGTTVDFRSGYKAVVA